MIFSLDVGKGYPGQRLQLYRVTECEPLKRCKILQMGKPKG